MEDAGCQNGLTSFKLKNAEDHVTVMRKKFTCVHVGILDPGHSLFGLGLSLATGQQLSNSSKNEDMSHAQAPLLPWPLSSIEVTLLTRHIHIIFFIIIF